LPPPRQQQPRPAPCHAGAGFPLEFHAPTKLSDGRRKALSLAPAPSGREELSPKLLMEDTGDASVLIFFVFIVFIFANSKFEYKFVSKYILH
jgi:hypothetical protein